MRAPPVLVLLGAAVLLAALRPAAAAIYAYTDERGTVHYSNVPSDPRYRLLIASPPEEGDGKLSIQTLLQRSQAYSGLIEHAAHANRLDPALVRAVIVAESACDPQATARRGARPDAARRRRRASTASATRSTRNRTSAPAQDTCAIWRIVIRMTCSWYWPPTTPGRRPWTRAGARSRPSGDAGLRAACPENLSPTRRARRGELSRGRSHNTTTRIRSASCGTTSCQILARGGPAGHCACQARLGEHRRQSAAPGMPAGRALPGAAGKPHHRGLAPGTGQRGDRPRHAHPASPRRLRSGLPAGRTAARRLEARTGRRSGGVRDSRYAAGTHRLGITATGGGRISPQRRGTRARRHGRCRCDPADAARAALEA